MHKLCGGKVPKFHNEVADDTDNALIEEIKAAKTKVESLIKEFKFRDALFTVIDLARSGNKYMQDKEPWIVAKELQATSTKLQEETSDDLRKSLKLEAESLQQKNDNCLHICLQLCANLTVLINPFLPNTAKKMLHMMKVVDKMLDWENAGSLKLLSVGYSLRAPELLFRKIEDGEIAAQIEKLHAGTKAAAINQQSAVGSQKSEKNPQISNGAESSPLEDGGKPEIQYDDFAKLDLRIGTIKTAEKVPKADKLLKLIVDLGIEERTIVSGIAEHFTPEALLNKQVIVVANLAPRKMRGIESQGMILLAEQPDGKLIFVSPESLVTNGITVR
jgi:methionyl-tRNA synthetase